MSDLPAASEAVQFELLSSEWPSSWPAWVRQIVSKMDAAEQRSYDWIPVQSREWVASMGVQIIRCAYPTLYRSRFDEPGPLLLGRMIGHQKQLSESLEGKLEKLSETLDELDAKLQQKLSKKTYARWVKKGERYVRDWEGFWEAFEVLVDEKERIAKEAVAVAYSQSAQDRAGFFKGLAEAEAKSVFTETGEFAPLNQRVKLYLLLTMFWRFVESFQTSTQLHRWCSFWLGASCVGDLATFQRLMRGHKVRLGARGKSFRRRKMRRRNRR